MGLLGLPKLVGLLNMDIQTKKVKKYNILNLSEHELLVIESGLRWQARDDSDTISDYRSTSKGMLLKILHRSEV